MYVVLVSNLENILVSFLKRSRVIPSPATVPIAM
jgi:hypothetical protein